MTSAVFACVDILTKDITKLPINVVKVTFDDDGNESHKVVRNHPISKLLRRKPNPNQNSLDLMKTIVSRLVLHGRSLALISRDGSGKVGEINAVPDELWRPELNDAGQQVFVVKEADGKAETYQYKDVLYFRGAVLVDGDVAVSPLQAAKKSIRLAQNYEKVQNKLTKNGGPTGILFTDPLGSDQHEQAVAEGMDKRFAADTENRTLLITSPNGKYQQVSPNSSDMQLDQASRLLVEKIAHYFRVPVEKFLHGTKSYASAVQTAQEYARESLIPHIKTIEEEMTRAFFGDDESWLIDIDEKDLLRASNLEQIQFIMAGMGSSGQTGVFTPNEGRYELGLKRDPDPRADQLQYYSGQTNLESEIEKEVERRLAAKIEEKE